MLTKRRTPTDAPTKEVRGGFPVHFHYTTGIVGEKFFYGLKDGKLLANTCPDCSKTYLPPKMFCEDCFTELTDLDLKDLRQTGELVSFTQTFLDHRGEPLENPYYLGLVKVDGADTVFFHKLITSQKPSIGMKVKAVWNDERKGSLFDLKGFEPA